MPSLKYHLPQHWTQPTGGNLRFIVPENTSEYQSICADFNITMQAIYKQILKIERIQNERWYIQYIAHSEDFKQRLNKDTERRLYHGCSQYNADKIIQSCFNRSYAGFNGNTTIQLCS
jgi:hypothetical protein